MSARTLQLALGAVALAALAGLGCVKHYHLEHNAPGHIDPRQPPSRKVGKLERPRDPGERMLAVTAGAFVGGGLAAFGNPSGVRGAYGIGPELSVVYGTAKRSHAEDDFVIFPRPAYGLNLGWTLLSYAGTSLGPMYAELQYSDEVVGIGVGWAYDRNDAMHGPQVTTSLGPLYLRSSYLAPRGFDVQLGLDVKGGFLWIWSQ